MSIVQGEMRSRIVLSVIAILVFVGIVFGINIALMNNRDPAIYEIENILDGEFSFVDVVFVDRICTDPPDCVWTNIVLLYIPLEIVSQEEHDIFVLRTLNLFYEYSNENDLMGWMGVLRAEGVLGAMLRCAIVEFEVIEDLLPFCIFEDGLMDNVPMMEDMIGK